MSKQRAITQLIKSLGSEQRRLDALEETKTVEIEAINEKYAAREKELRDEISGLAGALFALGITNHEINQRIEEKTPEELGFEDGDDEQ